MVIDELGRGGMGVVLRCKQRKTLKEVAVKILGWNFSDVEVIRFQQEARALARLQHPNILNPIDFGHSDDDSLFLVLELLKGKSLSQWIEANENIPFNDALEICIQICDGLAHAHAMGILHRDIKPANVFVLQEERTEKLHVTITDFGLAKLLSEDQHLTKTGIALGSPPYMSPEQVEAKPVDERADIYSLGCLMFELLTRTKPFDGDNVQVILLAQMNHAPPTLAERAKDVAFPPELEQIVAKCLAKNKEQRYANVMDLRSDLRAVQKQVEQLYGISDGGDSLKTRINSILAFKPSRKVIASCVLIIVLIAVPVLLNVYLYSRQNNARIAEPEVDLARPVQHVPEIPNAADPKGYKDPMIKEMAPAGTLKDIKLKDSFWEESRHMWVTVRDDETLDELVRQWKMFGLNPDWLDFSDSKTKDAQLKKLKEIPLRGIRLKNTEVSENGVESLNNAELAELDLEGTSIGDRAIQFFSKNYKVCILRLDRTRVTDNCLNYLALPSLKVLSLRKCGAITGSTLKRLKHDLRVLDLADSGLKRSNLSQLDRLGVVSLDLSGLHLDDADMAKLAHLKLGDLEVLKLNRNPGVTDTGLAQLVGLRRLNRIEVKDCPRITASGITKFTSKHEVASVVAQ